MAGDQRSSENQPPSEKQDARSAAVKGARHRVAMVSEQYAGPLPPPQMLQQYEATVPGAADRILRMAERESEHRRSLEREVVAAEREDRARQRSERRLGQVLGFVLCVVAIVAGAVVAVRSSGTAGQIMGGIIGAGGLASLVLALMTGQRPSNGPGPSAGHEPEGGAPPV